MSKNTMDAGTAALIEVANHVPCACGAYEIEIWLGEVPDGADPGDFVRYEGTDCISTTTRTFAPGHDAKLKSLLIRAGASGREVRREVGGVAVSTTAQKVAAAYGFGHQVTAGIKRLQDRMKVSAAKKAEKAEAKSAAEAAKAEAKAKREAAKAAKAEAKAAEQSTQPETVTTRIKVGRWVYDAVIDTKTNEATYTSSGGEVKTVSEDKWSLVTV